MAADFTSSAIPVFRIVLYDDYHISDGWIVKNGAVFVSGSSRSVLCTFFLVLPRVLGVSGIYVSQPAADILTILICILLIKPMKNAASRNMTAGERMQEDG